MRRHQEGRRLPAAPLRPVPLRRGDRPGRHGQARGRQTTAAGREGPGPRLRQAPASRRPGPGTAGRARQGPAAPGPGSGPSAAARRRRAPDHGRAEARRRRTTPEEHPPDGEGARRHAVGRQAPRQASGGPRRGTPACWRTGPTSSIERLMRDTVGDGCPRSRGVMHTRQRPSAGPSRSLPAPSRRAEMATRVGRYRSRGQPVARSANKLICRESRGLLKRRPARRSACATLLTSPNSGEKSCLSRFLR